MLMKEKVVRRIHSFCLVVGQADVEAAEPVPILSGRCQLASKTRRYHIKLPHHFAALFLTWRRATQ